MLPSYTTIPNQELNKLLMKKSNTALLLIANNKFNKKEFIDFGVVIGKAFVNDRYIYTKFGKVHYSKTGTHVVPYVKKEMKK